jgi:hypothetical protein
VTTSERRLPRWQVRAALVSILAVFGAIAGTSLWLSVADRDPVLVPVLLFVAGTGSALAAWSTVPSVVAIRKRPVMRASATWAFLAMLLYVAVPASVAVQTLYVTRIL